MKIRESVKFCIGFIQIADILNQQRISVSVIIKIYLNFNKKTIENL